MNRRVVLGVAFWLALDCGLMVLAPRFGWRNVQYFCGIILAPGLVGAVKLMLWVDGVWAWRLIVVGYLFDVVLYSVVLILIKVVGRVFRRSSGLSRPG